MGLIYLMFFSAGAAILCIVLRTAVTGPRRTAAVLGFPASRAVISCIPLLTYALPTASSAFLRATLGTARSLVAVCSPASIAIPLITTGSIFVHHNAKSEQKNSHQRKQKDKDSRPNVPPLFANNKHKQNCEKRQQKRKYQNNSSHNLSFLRPQLLPPAIVHF